jgi:hypothetical protein
VSPAAKPSVPSDARELASLQPGARGRISGVVREVAARVTSASPLRPGAEIRVLEATDEWLHVRIESREYSVPRDVAEQVLVTPEVEEGGPEAADAYVVLLSRAGRGRWLIRVISRSTASVVLSESFHAEPEARARFEELRSDSERLAADSFRGRHKLP